MHLVHVGIQFKREAGPIKILQSFALLGEEGEAVLLEQVYLAVFDVAIVETAHAAEQITDFDQSHKASVTL